MRAHGCSAVSSCRPGCVLANRAPHGPSRRACSSCCALNFPPLQLPTIFTQMIRLLPANTLLHIPSSCRLRMIAATAQCWQGMALCSDDFALLEERRSKLLLASVPPGLGTAAEVAKRLTLWEECRFGDLFSAQRGKTPHTPQVWQEEKARRPRRELTVLAEQPPSVHVARPPLVDALL